MSTMKLNLKELRLARGWTQAAVAEKAGMSQSYYTEIENGKKQINARRLESLADVFDVTPDELIATHGTPKHAEFKDLLDKLDADQKAIILNVARSLLQSSDKSK